VWDIRVGSVASGGERKAFPLAGPPGFEPGLTDPESVGLPLPHGPVRDLWICYPPGWHGAPTLANRRVHATGHGPRVSAVSSRLLDLVPTFQRYPRAERKAPRTVELYTEGRPAAPRLLGRVGMPLGVANITSEHIEAFIEDQQAGLRPSSARVRYASLGQFFKWVVQDGERSDSPMP
jgi:hypothetical protein